MTKFKIIQCDIGKEVKELFRKYPVVTITGPRQSGKTTLAKQVYPELSYFSLENISQSLAGRTAMLKLLPFTFSEARVISGEMNTNDLIIKRLYHGVHSRNLNPNKAYRNYYETCIERDLRQIINVKNLDLFRRFVKLCAGRVEQIWNASNLSTCP